LVRCEVIVSGAGPAGALAAMLLARAGVRVQLFDRARFPRPKLCGDTLNPGALRVLARSMPLDPIERVGLPLHGMILTGPGVAVRGTYGVGIAGRAVSRQVLDQLLVDEATRAGAELHECARIVDPIFDDARGVAGVMIATRDGRRCEQRATVVIAADGRESRLGRAVALTQHAQHPRRWAIGGYFVNAVVNPSHGEMHVRRGHYLGVAPVPGRLTNVCLVRPYTRASGGGWSKPAAMLRDAIRHEPVLAERFNNAELVDGPHVLGPMAVEARACGVPGMLLAGDASGFIDPITGDGLRFALEGATLAAEVVLDVLAGRCTPDEAPRRLASRRRAAFARKWQFNRLVRALVAAPSGVMGAAVAAKLAPRVVASVIRYAGDV
jgi:flavin-dependent dehydrogenase